MMCSYMRSEAFLYLGSNEERRDAEKLQLGQVQRRVAVEKEEAVEDCNGQMQRLVIQKQVVLKSQNQSAEDHSRSQTERSTSADGKQHQ